MFDKLHDTEAFVAADDTCLVVVFRGTKEGSDWATNLKFGVSDPPEEWGLEGENLFVHQVSFAPPPSPSPSPCLRCTPNHNPTPPVGSTMLRSLQDASTPRQIRVRRLLTLVCHERYRMGGTTCTKS